MSASNALNTPLFTSITRFVTKMIADAFQRSPRSIPCHVVKVNGDLVTVAFDTHNNIWLPAQIEMSQNFSLFAREPTQVGDKGFAITSDFYLGGASGNAGGTPDYFPRGNLSSASFQPVSQKKFPSRDVNQFVLTGGPSGIQIQSKDGKSSITITGNDTITIVDSVGNSVVLPGGGGGNFYLAPASGKNVYLGGTGSDGAYDFVVTASGNALHVKAKYA